MFHQFKLTQSMIQKLQLRLVGRIKMAEFLSIPEPEFEAYVREVEQDPLFKVLNKHYQIIHYRRFSDVRDTKLSQLKEEVIGGQGNIDPEDLLSDTSVFEIVKRVGETIGEKNFRKILTGKKDIKEVIREYKLPQYEVKIFQDFINKFQLQQITNPSSSPSSDPSKYSRFFLIAALEWEKDQLIIRPVKNESHLVKGKYCIDYQKFEKLVKTGEIKKSEADKMMKIFKTLDMINRRTTTIYRILHFLKEFQLPFFKSGNTLDLLPLSQSELARHLNFNPSTVSRAIADKSILTPQGEEKPIKFFFSRHWTKNLIRKIIFQEKEEIKKGISFSPLTDKLIQQKISKEYGIHLSRRSIAKYRKMLGIPSSQKRKKNI